MKLIELIRKLEDIRTKEGDDILVGYSESHDYWGAIDYEINDWDIRIKDHAQFDGPKKYNPKRAVMISKY